MPFATMILNLIIIVLVLVKLLVIKELTANGGRTRKLRIPVQTRQASQTGGFFDGRHHYRRPRYYEK
jgi:hypothetical protein